MGRRTGLKSGKRCQVGAMPSAETGELPALAEGAACLGHTSVGRGLFEPGLALLKSRTLIFLLSTRSQMLVVTPQVSSCFAGGGPQQGGFLLFSLFSFSALFRCILLYLVNVDHIDHPTKNLHSAALQNPIQKGKGLQQTCLQRCTSSRKAVKRRSESRISGVQVKTTVKYFTHVGELF